MKLHPRVTKTAVELVERFEGLRRRAARLPDGGWTIGYGHTLTAREGVEVTPEEAELLLRYDLSEVATKVEAWTFTSLNQNQFEALIAFAYNIGIENFRRSTVLKRINEGQHLQAAAAMELWRKTDVGGEGLVVDALVRRRAAEKAHYLTPPEGFAPSPSQVLRPVYDHSVIEAAAQSHAAARTAVVNAPLDGDHAGATVEQRPEGVAEAAADPASKPALGPVPPPAPHGPSYVQTLEIAGLVTPIAAAMAATPILRAPDADPAPAAPAVQGPVNDGATLQAPPFPTEPMASALPFRAFEPPPRRFGRTDDAPPPAAANEHLTPAPPTPESLITEHPAFAVLDAGRAPEPAEHPPEHPGDFNLFDRPLAPPEPQPPLDFQPVNAPALVMDDHDVLRSTVSGRGERSPSVLQDRTVLFSAIGLLGVALFTLAIFTMLTGKATVWHLLIGFLGVVLITPAGVFFLMRRMGVPPARDHADQA